MALKFLDEAGLSYFWSKLKTLLAGKVSKTGDTMTGKLVVPSIRAANTYYGLTFGRTIDTPVETILYTGIKWVSSTHMPVIHVTGYAYGLQSPVEFKIGFYIYSGNIGWSGVTNMGSWSPDVYLFKYTNDGVNYVAVGFAGKCYFLQLQADLQDEMGKFNNVVLNSGAWSWSFLTTAGTIPTPDSGATCIKVPYKADILNPSKVNGHTVNSDVPANAVFTDTTNLTQMTGTLGVGHGGTGKTTGKDAANYFMNALDTGSSTPVDADYYISQYVGGGSSTTTYHRRPMSALWEYVKSKISSVLGLTASSYSGSAAKVNNHTVASDVPANAVFTDTVTTATTSGSGNAVTAISASNGALTVTKGATFLTQHQDISGKANTTAVAASASIDATGLITFKNSSGTTLFTLQLPVYDNEIDSASVNNTGVVSLQNSGGDTLFTYQLPVYDGEVDDGV